MPCSLNKGKQQATDGRLAATLEAQIIHVSSCTGSCGGCTRRLTNLPSTRRSYFEGVQIYLSGDIDTEADNFIF